MEETLPQLAHGIFAGCGYGDSRAASFPCWTAKELAGRAAVNSPGNAVVYTAGSRALAALELLAYVNPGAEPLDLELFEVHLPDNAPTRTLEPAELDPGWRAPRHPGCRVRGDSWARSADTLLLVVPSAMIPEEPNYLINPAHPATAQVRVLGSRPFL